MHNGTGLITPRGSGLMSSSRKALQTLQMSSEKSVISVSEKDDHAKLQPKQFKRSGKKRKHSEKDDHVKLQPKANTETISNKIDSEQPSRTALNEHKEHLEVKLSLQEKVNSNNQIKLIEDLKKEAVSKCDEIIQKLMSTSDHDNYNYDDVISWMTANEPPEDYWKKLVQQRYSALEEIQQENDELRNAVNVFNTRIESLNNTIEFLDETFMIHMDEQESRAAEIERLREITMEVEQIRSELKELTEEIDE